MTRNQKVEGLAAISQPPDLPEFQPQELQRLLVKLRSGEKLTEQEHSALEVVVNVVAVREPAMVAQIAFRQESFSGPLPHFKQLNGYDDETRRTIVTMAAKEQEHTHDMRSRGLSGAIWKDRLSQICAVTIALGGFAAAAYMAQYSPAAAAVIGSFDILAIVCAFIAPRALEKIIERKSPPAAAKKRQPTKKR
ncbi:MAG: hypothetical protein JWP42_3993 [Pseudomonas sp.]|nr:hypothetical protein [Pseudomonas sp.]